VSGHDLLESWFSILNVRVKERGLKACALENLAHYCREGIHDVILDIERGRERGTQLLRQGLVPPTSRESPPKTQAFAVPILDQDKPFPVGTRLNIS
jgi:hypothetical protein